MKPLYFYRLSILISIFLFSGCHKEVYDPSALGRDYFIRNIPENFDWSTINSLELTVIPYDLYNGQYDYNIEVFHKNPLSEQAILYAKGWGSAIRPFQKTIHIPAIDTLLYIRQTSPGGRRLVKQARIEGKRLICDFNPADTTTEATLTTKSVTTFTEPLTVPTNAIPIEGNQPITLQKGNNYVIAGHYTQAITFPAEWSETCNLYITGNWEIPSSHVNLGRHCNLYIMENGKMEAQTPCILNWESYDGGEIYIAPKGQIGSEEMRNLTFQWAGAAKMINQGKLYCNKINITSYNQVYIRNKGIFYANEIEGSNVPYTFVNECYAHIKKLKAYNGRIILGPECSLLSKELNICGVQIYLNNSSVLKANSIVVPDYGINRIYGIGSEYALIHCDRIDRKYNPRIQLYGNLYLGFTHVKEDNYLCIPPHHIVMEDPETGASIEIKPTICNEGNDYEPEHPQPQEFPQTVIYNQSYTYASEDNFPSPGDFDLNDLVLSMDSVSCYYPKKDKISSLTWHFTLRAVGATRPLGAAIQFDRLTPDDIKKVSYSRTMPLTSFQVDEKQIEKGQEHAVIPLFDNAHQAIANVNTTTLINTVNNEKGFRVKPFSFEVTIEFNSPQKEELVKDNYNYFTIVGNKSKNRTEIHLPLYKHTNLSYASSSFQEVTKEYMWTIKVPGSFAYSQEWTNIKTSYPEFEGWVSSNRQENKNWYLHPDPAYIYKN